MAQFGAAEPRIMRHHRFRNDVARVVEVPHMPFVRIFVAHARDVRPGPLRSPEHRMIVFGFDGERVRPVALDFVAQRPDHLRMAGVAAFADVDVAACDLERRVDAHARGLFDGLVDREQGYDLHRTADGGNDDDAQHQADGLALEPVMQVEHAASLRRLRRGNACERGNNRTIANPLVGRLIGRPYRHPDVVGRDQRADQEQQAADGARDIIGAHRNQACRQRNRRAFRFHCRSATSAPG